MGFYLIFDLFLLLIPLLGGLMPQFRFYRKLGYMIPAILIPAILFIILDYFFITRNLWEFNYTHLSGMRLFKIPIEEVLYFLFFPFLGLFFYEGMKIVFPVIPIRRLRKPLAILATFAFIIIVAMSVDHFYTFLIFTMAALLISLTLAMQDTNLSYFFLTFGILLIPFTILARSLYAQDILDYNPTAYMGPSPLSVPIEDFGRAFVQLLGTIFIYEYLRGPRKDKKKRRRRIH